ncbi:hypothetical protein BO71DRAFT_478910 [Aspergillus ellipticus CBS 707.79]|uniref:Uncharacterized protein n=1 Tax=Aspergillus ellipticus CBS 707.79 TaxID=1448320 RepID=A0A319E0S7_9EURO|nr:hypothetical protein BO71DRAFT_478910 [Aspergillus ellipticus CBS 707.79]
MHGPNVHAEGLGGRMVITTAAVCLTSCFYNVLKPIPSYDPIFGHLQLMPGLAKKYPSDTLQSQTLAILSMEYPGLRSGFYIDIGHLCARYSSPPLPRSPYRPTPLQATQYSFIGLVGEHAAVDEMVFQALEARREPWPVVERLFRWADYCARERQDWPAVKMAYLDRHQELAYIDSLTIDGSVIRPWVVTSREKLCRRKPLPGLPQESAQLDIPQH